MAVQIWTTKWMKISTLKKLNGLPFLHCWHFSRFPAMLFKNCNKTLHTSTCVSIPLNRNHYVSASAVSNKIYKWTHLPFPHERLSSFHTCLCFNGDNEKAPNINLTSGSNKIVQSEPVTDLMKGTDSHVDSDSDSEDLNIKPSLDSIKPSVPPPLHVDIVPGKGPPPEPPVDCCMSGCANCVWIQYAEELKQYFSKDTGLERVKKDIEKIDNPGLQMFLKLELGLL